MSNSETESELQSHSTTPDELNKEVDDENEHQSFLDRNEIELPLFTDELKDETIDYFHPKCIQCENIYSNDNIFFKETTTVSEIPSFKPSLRYNKSRGSYH
ncbi:hypothetical protein EDI_213830 [Entamoeba dispar SAW760]|uniref:Uncharacterized protein n=1 Tax=Entamoeba dispar (strain ATCC PRA-260 / SAW760) TaxID=370354 RepID=B0E860_ENTDS|nr:uncharacterized protein EDI_213830 [Entamoeba dispar SAW760]EDR29308.1 hypothetical protein EDI_213830 [Entamoeba dispar SAW760]|eukprot:EDR29308.1 hypothetical protein EDI_213830 [Entamoeba dispar SAW760]